MEEAVSILLVICGALALVLGLGAFLWYGLLRGFSRTAIATLITTMVEGKPDEETEEEKPFDPETAPEHLSDIMVEQVDSLDFVEAVEKHRAQEVPTVRAANPLDEKLANRMAKRWRDFAPVSRTTQMVSRPFRFIHLRLRPDNGEVEVSPLLREDSESDVEE